MDIWGWIWIIIIIASLVAELSTAQMVSIWFTFGAVVALILDLANVSYVYQIITFLVIAILLIFSLRSIAIKYFNKNKSKTNLELIIGKRTKLLTDVSFDKPGTVKVNDVIWVAKSETETLNAGDLVEIVQIVGNSLFIKSVKGE